MQHQPELEAWKGPQVTSMEGFKKGKKYIRETAGSVYQHLSEYVCVHLSGGGLPVLVHETLEDTFILPLSEVRPQIFLSSQEPHRNSATIRYYEKLTNLMPVTPDYKDRIEILSRIYLTRYYQVCDLMGNVQWDFNPVHFDLTSHAWIVMRHDRNGRRIPSIVSRDTLDKYYVRPSPYDRLKWPQRDPWWDTREITA